MERELSNSLKLLTSEEREREATPKEEPVRNKSVPKVLSRRELHNRLVEMDTRLNNFIEHSEAILESVNKRSQYTTTVLREILMDSECTKTRKKDVCDMTDDEVQAELCLIEAEVRKREGIENPYVMKTQTSNQGVMLVDNSQQSEAMIETEKKSAPKSLKIGVGVLTFAVSLFGAHRLGKRQGARLVEKSMGVDSE